MRTSYLVGFLGWTITACSSDLSLGRGSDIDGPPGQDAATVDGSVANDRPVPVTFVLRNTGSKQEVTVNLPNGLNVWVTESGTNARKYVLPWFPNFCSFVCDPAECVGYTDSFTPPATDVAPGDEMRVTWDGVNWSGFRTREDGGECHFKTPLPIGVYTVAVGQPCSPDQICTYGTTFTYPPAGDVVIQLRSFPDECMNTTDCSRLND